MLSRCRLPLDRLQQILSSSKLITLLCMLIEVIEKIPVIMVSLGIEVQLESVVLQDPGGPPGRIGKMGPVGARGGPGARGEIGDAKCKESYLYVEGVVCIYETSDKFPDPNYPFGGQKRGQIRSNRIFQHLL